MLKRSFCVAMVSAGPVAAHPGAHLHPHDGAHWLAAVGALAVLALAGVAAARVRQEQTGQEPRK